ncbi:MAG: bifunctional DNA-formamidopyrimidine glycosylase/DNA-(apurinic or apyrimidinic site) lyase [Cellvibrionaceae bacterium]
MPELPEVETTMRGISPHVLQQTVKKVVVRQSKLRWLIPNSIKTKLPRKRIISINRRGKYLLLEFKSGFLIIHLGMSGSLRVVDSNLEPGKHDHFDLQLASGKSLRLTDPRRFGAVLWTDEPLADHKLLNHLGPEPLTDEFNAEMLFKRSRKRIVPIKTLIMDSKTVVGVGNIYANESLFLAGIRPTRPAGKITQKQSEELVAQIKKVLAKAIKAGGTTLKDFTGGDGKPGYFQQQLYVYGREGEPCSKCDTALKQIRIGQRSTVYCTQCQK